MSDPDRVLVVRVDDPYRRSFLRDLQALSDPVEADAVETAAQARRSLHGARFDAVVGASADLDGLSDAARSGNPSVLVYPLVESTAPRAHAELLSRALQTTRLVRENRLPSGPVAESARTLKELVGGMRRGRAERQSGRIRVLVEGDDGLAEELRSAALEAAPEWRLDADAPDAHLILFGRPLADPGSVERFRALRAALPRAVPIVVLVDGDDPSRVEAAYEFSANSVVARPRGPEEMIRFVRTAALLWKPPR